jgi:hypothetical protein
MSNAKYVPESYNGEDDFAVAGNEFQPEAAEFDLASMDDMEVISTKLLRQSYDFCNTFVPAQLVFIQKGISVANARMERAKSADEYMKLAATAKTLYASYSQLIEQSTVIFMSSYRPLNMLIETKVKHVSDDNVTVSTIDSGDVIVTDQIDISDIEDEYTQYIDE